MAEKKILGIDMRVCSVKIAELKKNISDIELLSFSMEEISFDLADKHPDKEYAQARIIQKFIADKNIKSRDAVVVISGEDVIIKRITLPKLSKGEIAQAISWKLKEEVSYPIEEAVFDYVKMDSADQKQENSYVAVAVKNETINRVLEISRLSGLNILSIIPVPIAIIELDKQLFNKKIITSLIYMGRRTTNISFVKEGQVLFNRDIPIGGEDITKAMTSILVSDAGQVEVKYADAEKIKQECGVPVDVGTFPHVGEIPVAQLQALVRPALEKIVEEICRTVEYFKSQNNDLQIEKIYFTGGSSRTPHMMAFLSSAIGIPFEHLPFPQSIKIHDPKNKESIAKFFPQLCAAIGASMVDLNKNVNLLPEEIRYRWKTLTKKYINPITAGVAFIVLLILVYVALGYYLGNIKDSLVDANSKLALIRPKLERLEEIEKSVREESGRRGIFQAIELGRIEIPFVLEEISASTPSTILLDTISIVEETKELRIKGVSFERGINAEVAISNFMLALSKGKFTKVQLLQASRTSGYLYNAFNFEISASIGK